MSQLQADELGLSVDGYKITVATDCAGSQVIARNDKDHFLSKDFGDHKVALEIGTHIHRFGISTYKEWVDLHKDPFNALLMACFNAEKNRVA